MSRPRTARTIDFALGQGWRPATNAAVLTIQVALAAVSLTCMAGCVTSNTPYQPRITSLGPVAAVMPEAALSPAAVAAPAPEPAVREAPAGWVPAKDIEKRWTAIVIHHSGTSNGCAEIFDRWHRDRQWDGVGYDFVIGNGTDSGDGEVEVTFRWREQRVGAHCKTPDNWANAEAVGICLVGNFNLEPPTELQKEALVRLVRFLQDEYGIPPARVYGHRATPGANETECPGSFFSVSSLDALVAGTRGQPTAGN
jgi:hypothetical protein